MIVQQDSFIGDEYFNDPAVGRQNENVRDFARPDFGVPPRFYDSQPDPHDPNHRSNESTDSYASPHDHFTPSSAPTQQQQSYGQQFSEG